MSLRVSFPGRYGDLLWALPTVRALSEQAGEPVLLYIAGEFASIIPVLEQQPYIAAVAVIPEWTSAEWDPPRTSVPPGCVHLGYRRWPELPLPYEIAKQAGVAIDLTRPWITLPPLPTSWGKACIPVGFTEAWFELKYGLLKLLQDELEWTQWAEDHDPQKHTTALIQMGVEGGRWNRAGWNPYTWLEAAEFIAASNLFFGDCSALHVLACALGKRVLLMEPMEARWNRIFYPYGMNGPQVTVVKGLDGLPTFDARHCAEAIRSALHG